MALLNRSGVEVPRAHCTIRAWAMKRGDVVYRASEVLAYLFSGCNDPRIMSALVTEELLAAISTLHAGEREQARDAFHSLWARLEPTDYFHRCILAHYMADIQDDPQSELQWDEIAFDAAVRSLPEDFADRFPGMTRASFFPSLHLNLAASYEKLGLLEKARDHAEHAHRAIDALPDSPLARMTAQAIYRIRARLCPAEGMALLVHPSRGLLQ